MHYSLHTRDAARNIIRIECELPPAPAGGLEICLPHWRPGRYELANYAENILDLEVRTPAGAAVEVRKTGSHSWRIYESVGEPLRLSYGYYARKMDAGSSFIDEEQLYVNGVNLFFYIPGRLDEAHSFSLDIPESFEVACSTRPESGVYHFEDFHELVDTPFIAAAGMHHHQYSVRDIPFHVWFRGNCKPDMERIDRDFRKFTESQLELFGSFPTDEYHFYFQIHNSAFYHGVEHQRSTVIALGPGYRLMEEAIYEDLLGVSCHELFHTWNVKAIRPADMRPYNYAAENYSRLHYVTEGVTTYYGDLMLLKSGVWDLKEFLKVWNQSIFRKHYSNDGHRHTSLEQASFDSWVAGYKKATPNRQISFYTKGALVAFLLDIEIRRATDDAHGLDDVMRSMYEEFGKSGTGYTREDYKRLAEAAAERDLDDFFNNFISGTENLDPHLEKAAAYLGLKFGYESGPVTTRDFGFDCEAVGQAAAVKQVFEGSPAEAAGLRPGDELVALDGLRVRPEDLQALIRHVADGSESIRIQVFREDALHRCMLRPDAGYRGRARVFAVDPHAGEDAKARRAHWMRVKQTVQ